VKEALLRLTQRIVQAGCFRQDLADGADERLDLVRGGGVLVGLGLAQLVQTRDEDTRVGGFGCYGKAPLGPA
jgi:hypothetical protein